MAQSKGLDAHNEQYFTAQPSTDDERRELSVTIRGNDYTVTVSNSVFSTHRLDLGTKVLLDRVPSPEDLPDGAQILDIGCGWGPISLAAASEAPHNATVWALDVNERAVELTQENARRAQLESVHAGTTESLTNEFGQRWTHAQFDLIWSNPPIRIGKEALHELLMTYLLRLKPNGGTAYLVVQKHLGADPLISWLDEHLNDASADLEHASSQDAASESSEPSEYPEQPEQSFTVSKYASAKGYRIIEVIRH
ncbi:methyltransferase domain-containing protein [Alloscardovia theropitheci]|uniref:Methyltransferase domain-containing protein n=1 Tax=Alloscardovia theropitheci TaxID=2496842 RepID=A0A4R0QP87_9BIFI|nr:methyltransferase [Alloscardovia theropitheci]TCD54023.1 methyltransferase domain-containing protein [Alloscardovia theropitheci]